MLRMGNVLQALGIRTMTRTEENFLLPNEDMTF